MGTNQAIEELERLEAEQARECREHEETLTAPMQRLKETRRQLTKARILQALEAGSLRDIEEARALFVELEDEDIEEIDAAIVEFDKKDQALLEEMEAEASKANIEAVELISGKLDPIYERYASSFRRWKETKLRIDRRSGGRLYESVLVSSWDTQRGKRPTLSREAAMWLVSRLNPLLQTVGLVPIEQTQALKEVSAHLHEQLVKASK